MVTTISAPSRQLICCEHCNTPVFEVRGDILVILARHHGEKHKTVIPLARLAALACAQSLDSEQAMADNKTSEQTTNR